MIKIGIIGMGIRGKMFASTITENAYAEIAAVSEYNETVLKEATDTFHVPVYQDYHKMIDEVEMDGIVVSTPDFLHKDAVIYAANKGIDILCEKPFSTSVKECGEMIEAIRKNHVKCMVAFENRWNSPVVAAKNTIDGGAVWTGVTDSTLGRGTTDSSGIGVYGNLIDINTGVLNMYAGVTLQNNKLTGSGAGVSIESGTHPTWFAIDDGSGQIRVEIPTSITIDPTLLAGLHPYVSVTGISSCRLNRTLTVPMIRLRKASDLVILKI
jgi:hypothetical protein